MSKIKNEDLIGIPKKLTPEILKNKVQGNNGTYTLKQFLDNNCIHVFPGQSGYDGIWATKSYNFFEFMPENRDINLSLVKQLRGSYREDGYKFPIARVTQNLDLIDAQHRFTAAKEEGLPIYFIIFPDDGVDDVITLNVNQKNWGDLDYLNSFLARYQKGEEKYESYYFFNKFYKKFNFSIGVALEIITNAIASKGSRNKYKKGELNFSQNMFIGTIDRAKKIEDIGQYHPKGASKRNFVRACKFVLKTPGYDHDHLMKNLRSYPDLARVMREASTMEIISYLEIITQVYDHKKHSGNRIRFDQKWRDQKY